MEQMVALFYQVLGILPGPFVTLFHWLIGVLFLLKVVEAICAVAQKSTLRSVFSFSAKLLQRTLKEIISATNDPVRHPHLDHAKRFVWIAVNGFGFLYFVILIGLSILMIVATADQITSTKSVLSVLLMAIFFLMCAVFKAETGRALIEYRNFRHKNDD